MYCWDVLCYITYGVHWARQIVGKKQFCGGFFYWNKERVNTGIYKPVTMMVLILASRSSCITGVVCGFNLFSMTKNPRNVKCFSTCSLKIIFHIILTIFTKMRLLLQDWISLLLKTSFPPKYTVESRYVKLGLLEISNKLKFFWSPVLNLIYSCYLKFRCVKISGISK